MKSASTLVRACATVNRAAESAVRRAYYSTLLEARPSSSRMFSRRESFVQLHREPVAPLHIAVLPTILAQDVRGHIQIQFSEDEARTLLRQLQDTERKEVAARLPDTPWSPLKHIPDTEALPGEPAMAIGHSPKRGPTETAPRRWTMRSREGVEYNVKQGPSTKIEDLSDGPGLVSIDVGKLSPLQAKLLATVITDYSRKDYSLSGRLPIPQEHWSSEEWARFDAHGEVPLGAPNCADFIKDMFAHLGKSMGPNEPGLQQFLAELYAAPRPQEVMGAVVKYFSADGQGFMGFKAPGSA